MSRTIALLTRESIDEVRKKGGTGDWVTNAGRAREYPFVVLVRNRNHPSAPSDTDHGKPFLVGRISGARFSASARNGYPRVFIEIDSYAPLNASNACWSKSQNPVWYTDLATLGIDENKLEFQPMLHVGAKQAESVNKDHVLADIKRQIGQLYNVPGSAVEVTIRL